MLAALLAFTLAVAPAVQDTTELPADSLLKVLRQGGYTILLRHARTDRSVMDQPNYSNSDRSTQRNLNAAGVLDAKAIGDVIRSAKIPIGEIVSSPMFRTKETAQMAFGEPILSAELRTLDDTPEQRALVAKIPAKGTNRALVTHHFVIERHVPGISLGEIGESEAAVIRTDGAGTIHYVGRFTLQDWSRLSGGKTGPLSVAGHTPPPGGHGAFASDRALQPPPGSSATVPPFVWTATAATKIAGLYLHAFNTGDDTHMRAFIERYLTSDPDRPVDARVATYREMFREHGPVSIVGTERATAAEATVRVRSKRGEFSVSITVSSGDSTRASSIRLLAGQ
jgi:phosphohistidine phosphatase SixA